MTPPKSPKYLRLELNEEEQRWWQKIKDQSGLRSDTECLRQLIFHKYQELMANESPPS
ncbi:MAG: hypothetical protein ACFFDI_25780 [Promethearchaeota archaeon]